MRSRAAILVAAAIAVTASGCSTDDGAVETGPGASVTSAPLDTTPTSSADSTAPDSTVPDSIVPDSTVLDSTVLDSTVPEPPVADPSTDSPPARLDEDLDATGFAARLSATHATMIDTTASASERASAGVEYQLVLRALADRPDLDEDVIASLDPAAVATVEPIVRARQFLQARNASRPSQPPPEELPAWSIVEPEPIDTLLAHYSEAEAVTGIAWYWLAAIHLQETRMGRIRGVSSAGAVGPMQFLPTTWEACCSGDPTVTRDAIIGAGTYLAQSGGPDDMAAAVYQYNPNDGYVAVVTAYAQSLRDEPELYAGYHAFQVFYSTSVGTIRLPIGYDEQTPVDAAAHLAANPADATT